MKPRRKEPDDARRGDNTQQRDTGDDREQRREYGARQFPGVAFRLEGLIFGEDRNEGRRHGPFREQFTQQVGNTIGDEEGIGRRRRAKEPRQHHVADEAEDAAGEGGHADQAGRFDHRASLILRIRGRWETAVGSDMNRDSSGTTPGSLSSEPLGS